MPLYAYRCTQCGHKFEKIQNFSAEPESVCPKCGGVLERPLTAPRLNFKGAGWYINDYAPKSGGSGSDSGSESGKDSAGSEKKADSSSGDSAASAPASTPAPATAPASTPSTSSTSSTSSPTSTGSTS